MATLPTEIPRIDCAASVFFTALADDCSLALAINVRVLFREHSGWVVPHKSQSAFVGTRQMGHLNSDCAPRIEASLVLNYQVSDEGDVAGHGELTIPHNHQRGWQQSVDQAEGMNRHQT